MSWWSRADEKFDFCERHQMTLNADGVCPADAKVRLPAYPPTQIGLTPLQEELQPDPQLVEFLKVIDHYSHVIAEVTDMPIPNPQYHDYDGPSVTLNPDDPFEAVVLDMVKTNRAKRADYAVDGSPFSNFDDTANALGIDGFNAVDSALFNVNQKIARLRSLRKNGRMNDPANESVTDTYLDLAVYACIALAIHKYPKGEVA